MLTHFRRPSELGGHCLVRPTQKFISNWLDGPDCQAMGPGDREIALDLEGALGLNHFS